MKFLCWFGWHRWAQPQGAQERICTRCGEYQELEFYSNRTQEWVSKPHYWEKGQADDRA